MKEKLSKEVLIIAFIIGSLIVFNLFPFLSTIIEYKTYNIIEFLSLVFINPIYVVICGFIYGKKYGISWFLSLILSFCFIPTVLLFFDIPYLFYILIYIIFVIPSEILGISFNKIANINL